MSSNEISEVQMPNQKWKILETYKRTAIIPFDATETAVVFKLRFDEPNSTQTEINVTIHLLIAMISANFFLFSLLYYIFSEANTFAEYSEPFLPIAVIFVGICSCIIQISVRAKFITLIDNFDMVIEERKYYPILVVTTKTVTRMRAPRTVFYAANQSMNYTVEQNKLSKVSGKFRR